MEYLVGLEGYRNLSRLLTYPQILAAESREAARQAVINIFT
jgi:hypothetical protein